jgi:glycosyltransferase involved in cell wall biosynthesis
MQLRRLYAALGADLVYQVALKPVLLGSVAARFAGVRRRVNALGGLGFLFGVHAKRATPLRVIARLSLGAVLRADQTIVQNEADYELLLGAGVPASNLHLICGVGVDLDFFAPTPEPEDSPVVIALVSRMIWEKGVGELVTAARLLAERRVPARVVLVGAPDPDNPRCISQEQLIAWSAEGFVEWLGPTEDVPTVWRDSHIAVLPSYYREGLPKALMEAAACGRPIVTTDAPGCRDAILPGRSGLLVTPRDPVALADALERLVSNGELRRAMGVCAREDAERRFSDTSANERILALCDKMFSATSLPAASR